jgi:hypothetical protein
MARSVKLWEGRTDDTKAPPRVRLRVFERFKGRCHACGRAIQVGEKWTLEHLVALINGGRNAEDNLCLTCCNCLPAKNAADVAEKSKLATIRKKHRDTSKPKYRWPSRKMNPPRFDNTKRLEEL